MIKIAKTKTIYSGTDLSEVGGNMSDLNLFVFFLDDGELKTCALFANETSENGVYQGSINNGRWSAVAPFSHELGDRCPVIHMRNGEPDLVLWERGGGLMAAPSSISAEFLNAQTTRKAELDDSFSIDLANLGGKFTREESQYRDMFDYEKSAALEAGYAGELIRMATGQIDPTKATRTISSGVLSLEYKNKYSELLGLQMTKIYGLKHPNVAKQTMISGFKVSSPIPAGQTVEVRFEATAPARWYPGSVEIVNLTPVAGMDVSKVYGTSEWYGFVQITNTSGAPIQPIFDVIASPCSGLAFKVLSGTLTVEAGSKTSSNLFLFNDNLVEPGSIQLQITSVTNIYFPFWGRGIFGDATANLYLFAPSVNGCGVQAVLNQAGVFGATINFEIWARPYNTDGVTNGRYWTAREVIEDIAKIASRKELKLGEKSDKLASGQFTDTVFVQIEEGFDPESVRIENTGSTECQFDIIQAGEFYWPKGSNNKVLGCTVAITRTFPTGPEVDYSFQIWGQYTDRTDFLFPLRVDMESLPTTQFTKPLNIIDQTIEDALNKVNQVCFSDRGESYRIMFDRSGAIRMAPYWTTSPALTVTVRNMESITKSTQQPKIIDRLEIKGHISNSFIIPSEKEKIHQQDCNVGAGGMDLTVNFKQSYDPGSLEIRNTGNYNSHQWIKERNPNYCIIGVSNDCPDVFGLKIGSAWAHFAVWGRPLSSVQYQEDNTYKTPGGVSGKYTHVEATIENELITDPYIAGKVAEHARAESANGEKVLEPANIPANPGIDPGDTMMLYYDELDATTKAIIDEVAYRFNAEGDAPEFLMTPTARPFDIFAAGSGDDEITKEDETELDDEYEVPDDADIKKLLNLLFT